jgi:hypothetical protein
MKSKHFLSLAMIGVGLALAGMTEFGCGGGGGTGTPGSGGTTVATSSHSSAGHTVSASSSSSTTGGGSAGSGTGGGTTGGHDPMSAMMLTLDMPSMATLVDTKTPDYYTFTTTVANDRLFIAAFATGLGTNFTDPTVFEPTLALFDNVADATSGKQMTYAGASNPYQGQNAELYVEIATPGTYYLKIEDCIGMFGAASCANTAANITNFDYEILVAHPAKLNLLEVNADPTKQNGMTSGAQTVMYKLPAMAKAGNYGETVIDGNFKNATDTHVFSFTPPMDTANPNTMGTPRAQFYVQPINGSGMMDEGGDVSDANIKLWVTDSTGSVILSSDSQSNYVNFNPLNFSVPVALGTQYYLFVQNTQASGSMSKDYYFIRHFYNDLIDVSEKEPATMGGMNDTAMTSETMAGQGAKHTLFTVDGHVAKAGTGAWPASDTDWYNMIIPPSVTSYGIQCDSARSGSGLNGFTAQLFQSDGTTSVGMWTESAMTDLNSGPNYVPLPTGVSPGAKLFLQITASTQDTTDTGTQYRCYVFFN